MIQKRYKDMLKSPLFKVFAVCFALTLLTSLIAVFVNSPLNTILDVIGRVAEKDVAKELMASDSTKKIYELLSNGIGVFFVILSVPYMFMVAGFLSILYWDWKKQRNYKGLSLVKKGIVIELSFLGVFAVLLIAMVIILSGGSASMDIIFSSLLFLIILIMGLITILFLAYYVCLYKTVRLYSNAVSDKEIDDVVPIYPGICSLFLIFVSLMYMFIAFESSGWIQNISIITGIILNLSLFALIFESRTYGCDMDENSNDKEEIKPVEAIEAVGDVKPYDEAGKDSEEFNETEEITDKADEALPEIDEAYLESEDVDSEPIEEATESVREYTIEELFPPRKSRYNEEYGNEEEDEIISELKRAVAAKVHNEQAETVNVTMDELIKDNNTNETAEEAVEKILSELSNKYKADFK